MSATKIPNTNHIHHLTITSQISAALDNLSVFLHGTSRRGELA